RMRRERVPYPRDESLHPLHHSAPSRRDRSSGRDAGRTAGILRLAQRREREWILLLSCRSLEALANNVIDRRLHFLDTWNIVALHDIGKTRQPPPLYLAAVVPEER